MLHSHLGMVGAWGVYGPGRRWSRSARRAWVVLRSQGQEVVEFDGPLLELMTDSRTRFDQRLAALGPDVLATEFDRERFLRRLRQDDQTRFLGDALLDQRNVAGIGNIWKAEGCWEAGIDPWRPVSEVTDDEAVAIIEAMRPRMQRSAHAWPSDRSRPGSTGTAAGPARGAAPRSSPRGAGRREPDDVLVPGCQKSAPSGAADKPQAPRSPGRSQGGRPASRRATRSPASTLQWRPAST